MSFQNCVQLSRYSSIWVCTWQPLLVEGTDSSPDGGHGKLPASPSGRLLPLLRPLFDARSSAFSERSCLPFASSDASFWRCQSSSTVCLHVFICLNRTGRKISACSLCEYYVPCLWCCVVVLRGSACLMKIVGREVTGAPSPSGTWWLIGCPTMTKLPGIFPSTWADLPCWQFSSTAPFPGSHQ